MLKMFVANYSDTLLNVWVIVVVEGAWLLVPANGWLWYAWVALVILEGRT